MKSSQINYFLSLFCKELSYHLDTARNRQENISPPEFAELVSIATKEVLDHYLSGEMDIHEYNSHEECNFHDIARFSIDSYTQSNQSFEKISEDQAEVLKQTSPADLINFNKLSEKLADIQLHLESEVSKANSIIQNLNIQVQNLELTTTLDPLTKTYNRHALQKHFDEILSKKLHTDELFVIMLDIDNFKQINDQFGHIAGDKILIFIAKLLKKALRDGDKVYRFGGEEFLVVLNRTDLEGAKLVTERLLVLSRQNKPLYQNEQISVTLSLGLTKIRENDTLDTVIHHSDTAMYRAKNNGKDRYEMEL